MSIIDLINNHEENVNELIRNNNEYHKYLDKSKESWNKLIKTGISDGQRVLVENIEATSGCIGSITSEICYQKGFRDAMKLIIESLVY
ncbi:MULTISPECIES: hypothetical protein [unclassified Dehalobacter]|uniref:hypothetical protein n=1 Tax=unclassified Dehalobacter TaxID=2635733 RepID=UPI000E6C0A8F|nr:MULTISPECIES: hypothetical protein [unclassified Dehalobacter]RJE47191.1 hypothetical protein A7K50_04255 [Dehalobacter sp. MCB1]TCX53646.1 hypothetical protein C1I36_02585 [Dehalobacter sp. 14DCB1]TCX54949.1 hypothetical protein C1I38_04550 [Dehalobacter sp. 12DCB1]UWG96535.1 hypothetical protein LPY66_16825 [Dehalobacter sp. DCM]